MHEIDDRILQSWEACRRKDIWPYKTLLSMIVESDENQTRLLNEVIVETERIEPSERVELSHIIAKLEQNTTQSPRFIQHYVKQDIHLS